MSTTEAFNYIIYTNGHGRENVLSRQHTIELAIEQANAQAALNPTQTVHVRGPHGELAYSIKHAPAANDKKKAWWKRG